MLAVARTSRLRREHLGFARVQPWLEEQGPFEVERWLRTDVFNATLAVSAQTVEPKAVGCRIDFSDQPRAQGSPRRRIDFAFEHRILNPLTEVETGSRHASQPALAGR
jgi:hypothetical protein